MISSCPCRENRYERHIVGLWRSLVARPSGGRKVAGSSPASPTNLKTAPALTGAGGFRVLGAYDGP